VNKKNKILILFITLFLLIHPIGMGINITYLDYGDSNEIFENKNIKLDELLKFFPNIKIFLDTLKEFIQKPYDTMNNDEPWDGYTLFGPEYSRFIYLLDINGEIVYTWESDYIQGFGNYLTEKGELYRLDLSNVSSFFVFGGMANRVAKYDKNSNLLWEFEYSNDKYCAHHDIEPLPNGNVLIIAWESKTKEEGLAAGRNPNTISKWGMICPDHIIEIEPIGNNSGKIVWEWHVWDHLIQDYDSSKDNYGIVQDHPELIDINFGFSFIDWNHINSIDYNEDLDQILLSVHNFNEIWVIDHSTTSKEASSHKGGRYGKGGDLLYRWGNPQTYRAGNENDQKFFGQHGANWVEKGCRREGDILVFNNFGGNNRDFSTVDRIVPPIDSNGNYNHSPGQAYQPKNPIWTYSNSYIFSSLLSNAQYLPNGNTLICSTNQGYFIEVTPDKESVWKYQNVLPTNLTNSVARIYRYPKDYPGIPEKVIKTNQ